jgi:glycosyltransferase involved in cell wall biosynthesis
MKVAIVCDWLTGYGGAERVVLELHRLFPDAPIYTSQYNPRKLPWFDDATVIPLPSLQRIPPRFKKFLPLLRARAFSRLKLEGFDVVITSSGAEAKAVQVGEGTKHILYCHAPTHYYWQRYDEYMEHPGLGMLDPVGRLGLRSLVGRMRRWDYAAAQKPDYIIANSRHTAAKIKEYYGRKAEVIHPPVDVERFTPQHPIKRRSGFVIYGRQTPYKRIDLAVQACTRLKLHLTVIGNGPDHKRLQKMAGRTIKFLTNVSDQELPHYLQTAEAFLFPGIDDFGISAVEPLAAGTPVIAFGQGGALDIVTPGKTGVFFEQQTVDALVEVLQTFDYTQFKEAAMRKRAAIFAPEEFDKKINSYINKAIES